MKLRSFGVNELFLIVLSQTLCAYPVQEVAMIIFHLLFHAMMALIQFLSFCVIAFVASNFFKSGSWNCR